MPRRPSEISLRAVPSDCDSIEADAAWLEVTSILLRADSRQGVQAANEQEATSEADTDGGDSAASDPCCNTPERTKAPQTPCRVLKTGIQSEARSAIAHPGGKNTSNTV